MSQLKSVSYACTRLDQKPQRIYALIRENILPPGVVVRLGRQIRINPEKLEEFIAGGGQALGDGWKRGGRAA